MLVYTFLDGRNIIIKGGAGPENREWLLEI